MVQKTDQLLSGVVKGKALITKGHEGTFVCIVKIYGIAHTLMGEFYNVKVISMNLTLGMCIKKVAHTKLQKEGRERYRDK